MALWVSNRGTFQGMKNRESGTIEPTTAADMARQRASGRENGKTAAAWDRVKGMKRLDVIQRSCYGSKI
jgi:hypothetical protein